MNTLAILLTVHNRKEKTLLCLDKVYSQLPIDGWSVDIYLTDDGCTDGTAEAIAELFHEVNIVKGDGNLYWNHGMIKAWETASKSKNYSAYLWLNDDTLLFENVLEKVLYTHLSNSNSILVGSTKASDSNEITYGGSIDFHNSGNLIIPNGKLQKCGIFCGNFVLVPAYVFHILGGLDPYYTHALGDSDYGLRAVENGIEIFVLDEIVGICDKNVHPPKWRDANYSLSERYAHLNSPLAYTPPREYFHFKKKHWGLLNAAGSLVLIYKTLLFPIKTKKHLSTH